MDLERKCDAGKRKALLKTVLGRAFDLSVGKGFAPFTLRLPVCAGDEREILLRGGRDGKVDALAVSAYGDVAGGVVRGKRGRDACGRSGHGIGGYGVGGKVGNLPILDVEVLDAGLHLRGGDARGVGDIPSVGQKRIGNGVFDA